MKRINRRMKTGILQKDNQSNPVILESRELLRKYDFSEDTINYYTDQIATVLNDYAVYFGENTEIEYTVSKRFGRLEALVSIPGEKYDPFETGDGSNQRKIEKLFTLNLGSQVSCINYTYLQGRNVVSGSVPLNEKKKSILKDPIILAVLLGIAVGLICQHLPENASSFMIQDLLEPVYSVLLSVLSGIMGPVIFISLITSIISLNSVNELSDLGFKIFKRFLWIILFVIILSIGVSILFFANFGPGGMDFSPGQIISMLLNIIPVNPIGSFLENNTPQIVMLAFVAGLALLVLGDRTKDLKNILHQCNDWVMSIMSIVNKVLPTVPFLSIAITIGKGNGNVLIEGWKFIAASYIIFTLIIVIKIAKTGAVTKLPVRELLRKSKPAILTAFATSSTSAPLSQMYEISRDELHIKPEFSSFWIPMCQAMLALKTAVNVVVATMMMTELLGMPISLSFLFVLIIITTEMTLASPGTTGSWVMAFEAFSIPTSYVGLFSTYRVLTINYTTAVVMAYFMLEQTEAAYKMGAIETTNADNRVLEEN